MRCSSASPSFSTLRTKESGAKVWFGLEAPKRVVRFSFSNEQSSSVVSRPGRHSESPLWLMTSTSGSMAERYAESAAVSGLPSAFCGRNIKPPLALGLCGIARTSQPLPASRHSLCSFAHRPWAVVSSM